MVNEISKENGHLSRIETLWSVVRQAHDSNADQAANAQTQLLDRYGNAIRRYLIGAVKDTNIADELFQEFAFKFVKGDFKSVDPERGKFRSYVKTVLFRMVAQYYRKQNKRKEMTLDDIPEPDSQDETDQSNELFLQSWREDMLSQTWQALEAYESQGGAPYNTILRIRVSNPAADSGELATLISSSVGRKVTPGNARVQVHRAREKFAYLLIETIADSLPESSCENIESELIELRLIDYCKEVLEEFRKKQAK